MLREYVEMAAEDTARNEHWEGENTARDRGRHMSENDVELLQTEC